MQALAAFFDADGNEAKAYVWHAPVKNPEMAGWITSFQTTHIVPGYRGTLKWIYQVPANKVKNSLFVLWQREELVQSVDGVGREKFGARDPTSLS